MEDIFKGLELSEEAQTTLTERIESEVKARISGAKNDPEFVKKIRAEESGKFFATMEKTIKKLFDVKPEDLEGDLTGLKRQQALLQLGISNFEKNKDKTNQDLQDELIAAGAKYTELEDSIPGLIEKERKSHFVRFTEEKMLKDTLGFETVCSEKARVSIFKSFLDDKKLKVEWNPEVNDYTILRKSDNLKYVVDGKELSKDQIIEAALDEGGVLKKSNGSGGGEGRNREEGGTPRKGKLSPNAQAMKDRLAGVMD